VSELPKGWVETTIGKTITLNDKHTGIQDDIECGFVPMSMVPIKYGESIQFELKTWQECKKGYTHFKDNDVLLAKITPCFENGKGALVDGLPNGIGAGSTEYFVLRSIDGLIQPKYLHAFVKTKDFLKNCEVNMSGSVGHKRVPKDFLLNYPLPIAPLAEQKRIVEKLDQVLAQVDTIKARLDGIPAILKRFRQSVLAAAVSGKLTEEWRGKDEEYTDICDYKVPSSWLQSSIDGESEYVTSGSRGWAKYYSEAGSLFIRSQDINTDELEIDEAAFVRLPTKVEGQRTKVQKEDLLITITGANVTKCARLKIELDDAYISQHVALIRLKNAEDSPFIELVLKALNAGRKQLTDLAYGGGKPGLNLQNIKDVTFSKPLSKERDEIVRLVDQYFAFADTIEKQVQKAQQRVDKLTQSILAKAFRGELVPQNPDDEPADQLLKRIAAARAESEALAKAAKKVGKRKNSENQHN
jgi:type I restriction enzyme, S subunit